MSAAALITASLLTGVAFSAPPTTNATSESGLLPRQTRTVEHSELTSSDHAERNLPTGGGARLDPGTATISAADLSRTSADAGLIQAGDLPISIGTQGSLGGAHVTILDSSKTTTAGAAGLLFTVESDEPLAAPAAVRVAVDYRAFARAGGADYAQRLRLVQLADCAPAAPSKPACQSATPLKTTNSYDKMRLTALASMPANGRIVMAATSDANGVSNNAAATSLKPSGSWSTSGATGGFSWSYPIAVPPVAAGSEVAPTVSLSYSSADVDGKVAGTNAQSSWLGVGWDYTPGFIERTYRPCADDTTAGSKTTQDLCWGGQVVTMSLNGQSTPLVYDDTATAGDDGQVLRRWHAANDNLQRVELVGAAPNGYAGEYWRITTSNGIQYFFGKNSVPGGAQTTNSTWKVRVYGPHAGDPCNAAGSCTQAWRWNLDYIVDPNNNAAAYYYTPETNYYGANNTNTAVGYDRGGYLNRIDYGLHIDNGSAYANGTPQQVSFAVDKRCMSGDCTVKADGTIAAANQVNWQDAPVDLLCPSSSCTQHSPSFFTLSRLTSITTSVKTASGTRQTVDKYVLRSEWPNNSSSQLWLRGVTRAASGGTGGDIQLDEVTFNYTDLANRVAAYGNWPAMPFGRLTRITSETGSVTTVEYSNAPAGGPLAGGSTAPCDQSTFPGPKDVTAAQLQANTRLCYPVYWTPPYETDAQVGLAWKYVVTKITTQDPATSSPLSPPQVTSFGYDGTPAWRLDDTELTKPKNRTYSQFRGYQTVETTTGDIAAVSNGNPDKLTLATTTYLRGMAAGPVPNSRGTSAADDNAYAGAVYETRVFNGLTAADEVSATIVEPTAPFQTGSRDRSASGLSTPLIATRVATAHTTALVDKTSTATVGDVTTKTTSYLYDDTTRIRPVKVAETGDDVTPLCTFTTYADNTSSWIRLRPARVTQASQVCPATGTTPTGTILSDVSTFYDGSTTPGAVPAAANPTQTATSVRPGVTARVTFGYDSSGRLTSTTAADSQTGAASIGATVSFTPAVGGPLTSTTTTNALNQTTTRTVSADRNLTLTNKDVAGLTTTNTYDALGRPLAVWLPNRSTTKSPNTSHQYVLENDRPQTETTKQLVDTGSEYTGDGEYYLTTVTIADALGQVLQTQTDAEGGNTLVATATYDSHGWATATARWGTTGTPSTTLLQTADSGVRDRTLVTYDQVGRTVRTAAYNGTRPVTGMTTSTYFGGDRTTIVPPTGGVTSTVVHDVNGKPTANRRYTRTPSISGTVVSGGAPETVTYTYDALGRMSTMQDSDYTAAAWNWTYDQTGNVTSMYDPDSGSTNNTYNDYGQKVTSTDANDTTLAYTYDVIGRRSSERLGTTAGTVQASWTYDTLQVGKLTSSTRKTGNDSITVAATGYDSLGLPTGSRTTIPASAGTLAGSYLSRSTYSSTGLLLTLTPAPGGKLPADEVLHYAYTHQGRPLGLSGDVGYNTAATYDFYGQLTQQTRSVGSDAINVVNTWNPQSHRLTKTELSTATATPQLDSTAFGYDPAGNVTSITNTQGPTGAPVEKQCFTYDKLARLTEAYTNAGADCITTPNTVTAGNIAGTQRYWQTWTYDSLSGGQATILRHSVTGSADQLTEYRNGVTGTEPHAHALGNATTTVGNTVTSQSYTYDAAGQTVTGSTSAGAFTNNWNAQHRLKSTTVGTMTRTASYDADNNLVLEQTPDKTTVYLPGEELALDKATGVVTGTRHYAFASQIVAVRVGDDNALWLFGNDQHGTAQIAYDPHTKALSRRQFDPYGTPVGQTTGVAWPDLHGYLGAPQSSGTGLLHVGAREYDPNTGRFLSVDPVVDPADPQQNNGYDYAHNAPTTKSDPTGTRVPCFDESNSCGANGVPAPAPPPGAGGGSSGGAAGGQGSGTLPSKDYTTRHNQAVDAAVDAVKAFTGGQGEVGKNYRIDAGSKKKNGNYGFADVYWTFNGVTYIWEVKSEGQYSKAVAEATWYVNAIIANGGKAALGFALGGPYPTLRNRDEFEGPAAGGIVYRPRSNRPPARVPITVPVPEAVPGRQPVPIGVGVPTTPPIGAMPGASPTPTPANPTGPGAYFPQPSGTRFAATVVAGVGIVVGAAVVAGVVVVVVVPAATAAAAAAAAVGGAYLGTAAVAGG